jgi:hypothetical protein
MLAYGTDVVRALVYRSRVSSSATQCKYAGPASDTWCRGLTATYLQKVVRRSCWYITLQALTPTQGRCGGAAGCADGGLMQYHDNREPLVGTYTWSKHRLVARSGP